MMWFEDKVSRIKYDTLELKYLRLKNNFIDLKNKLYVKDNGDDYYEVCRLYNESWQLSQKISRLENENAELNRKIFMLENEFTIPSRVICKPVMCQPLYPQEVCTSCQRRLNFWCCGHRLEKKTTKKKSIKKKVVVKKGPGRPRKY